MFPGFGRPALLPVNRKHMLGVNKRDRVNILAVLFPGFGGSAFHPVGWGGKDVCVQLQARVPASES